MFLKREQSTIAEWQQVFHVVYDNSTYRSWRSNCYLIPASICITICYLFMGIPSSRIHLLIFREVLSWMDGKYFKSKSLYPIVAWCFPIWYFLHCCFKWIQVYFRFQEPLQLLAILCFFLFWVLLKDPAFLLCSLLSDTMTIHDLGWFIAVLLS